MTAPQYRYGVLLADCDPNLQAGYLLKVDVSIWSEWSGRVREITAEEYQNNTTGIRIPIYPRGYYAKRRRREARK